jgi:hypothetical protein
MQKNREYDANVEIMVISEIYKMPVDLYFIYDNKIT